MFTNIIPIKIIKKKKKDLSKKVKRFEFSNSYFLSVNTAF